MTELFNTKLLKLHRDFAASNLHKSEFIIKHAIDDIIDHLQELKIDFKAPKRIIEIGARHGLLSKILQNLTTDFTATDFSELMLQQNPAKDKILMDNDSLNFPENSADLIVSSMNLHWVNDVRSYAQSLFKILKQDGVFVANFIGDGSLNNLKNFLLNQEIENQRPHIPHIIPMIPADKLYMLFQEAGFKFIVVARIEIDLEYDNPIKLMKDLKNMGENNAIASDIIPLPQKILANQISEFKDQLSFVSLVVKKV